MEGERGVVSVESSSRFEGCVERVVVVVVGELSTSIS